MSIRERILLETGRKVITITLDAEGDDLLVLNSYVDSRLQLFKDTDDIKWYSNKVDFFVVMPQDNWEPAELAVELKRRLGL
ncbi:MAG: hypothetical protein ACLQF0_02030 [Dissulfurispiraceae bacterium]